MNVSSVGGITGRFVNIRRHVRFMHRMGNIGCCGSSVTSDPAEAVTNLGTFPRGVRLVTNNCSGRVPCRPLMPCVLRGIRGLCLYNTATSGVRGTMEDSGDCGKYPRVVEIRGVRTTIGGTCDLAGTKSVITLDPTDTDFSTCPGFITENGRFGRLMGGL